MYHNLAGCSIVCFEKYSCLLCLCSFCGVDSCDIVLEGDGTLSRHHGSFTVKRASGVSKLMYEDKSRFGTTIGEKTVKGEEVVLLDNSDTDRVCNMVFGATMVTVAVTPVRVWLLHETPPKTPLEPEPESSGLVVDDFRKATHFVVYGTELSHLSPQLLFALAAARPIVSIKWLYFSLDDKSHVEFFKSGFSTDFTQYLPTVAMNLEGFIPFKLRPDKNRSTLLQNKTFTLDENVSSLYKDVLLAAQANVVPPGTAGEVVTLVNTRTAGRQLTVSELAHALLNCKYTDPPDKPPAPTHHGTPPLPQTAAGQPQIRPRPSSDPSAVDSSELSFSEDSENGIRRKKFRKSHVLHPDSYVDVFPYSE